MITHDPDRPAARVMNRDQVDCDAAERTALRAPNRLNAPAISFANSPGASTDHHRRAWTFTG